MLISEEGIKAIQIATAQEAKISQLQAEIKRLAETSKRQGENCMHRHNLLCEIKKIIDSYFEQI